MLNHAIPRPKRRSPSAVRSDIGSEQILTEQRLSKQKPKEIEREIIVREEHVTLGQLLKIADIVQSGGEAKLYLAEIPVEVNGEPEQRRGRKLRPGDLIVTGDFPPIRLIASPDIPSPSVAPADSPPPPPTRPKQKPGGDFSRISDNAPARPARLAREDGSIS